FSNVGSGISISLSSGTVIGNFLPGTGLPGGGNVIANSNFNGVLITSTTSLGNSILGNSIFNGGNQAIDLRGASGRDLNDLGDGDIGPNGLQNYPAISSVVSSATQTSVVAALNSKPSTAYHVEYFITPTNSSGSTQGRTSLGGVDVTTDAAGNANASA